MFTLPPLLLITPVAVVAIDLSVILSTGPAIVLFESVAIVNSVPGHVVREPISTMRIPMPKFPVPLKPTRQEPAPGVHTMVIRDVRPVLDLVCRCIHCTDQKQTYAEAQRADRAFHDVTHICIHGRLHSFGVGSRLILAR